MIRYELKDKERQAALEKALPGFKEECQRVCEGLDGHLDEGTPVTFSTVNFDATSWARNEWSLVISASCLEVIEEYDPKKWNSYPEVTPPEDVWMRVETQNACGVTVRGVFMYVNGTWRRGKYTVPNDEIKVARFRPWDEEGEE
nr:MAG TPA: hypothetical protein [Caudoviricetes sp.]